MIDEALAQEREEHIQRLLGEPLHVYYDVGTVAAPIDVQLFRPGKKGDRYVLVSVGMSDRPMQVPQELEDVNQHALAELVMALPADWFPYFPEDIEEPERTWPVRLLGALAALPHQHQSWLGMGHTVPSTQGPYHPTTKLRCALLLPPLTTPREFRQLRLSNGQVVSFHGVVLLYAEEAQQKLDNGLQALLEAFEKKDVTELLDPRRPNLFPPQLDSAVFNELENTETVSLKLSQAQALVHAGRLEEALLAFRAIAELHPAEQGACEARCGDACMELKRYEEAIEWYQQALVHGADSRAMQKVILAARAALRQEPSAEAEVREVEHIEDEDEDEGVPTSEEMMRGCAALGGGTVVLVLLGCLLIWLVGS